MFGQPFFSVLCGNDTGEHGAAGTVGIGDGVFQRDFLLVLYGFGGGMQYLYIFHMVDAMLLVGDVADGGFIVYACQ